MKHNYLASICLHSSLPPSLNICTQKRPLSSSKNTRASVLHPCTRRRLPIFASFPLVILITAPLTPLEAIRAALLSLSNNPIIKKSHKWPHLAAGDGAEAVNCPSRHVGGRTCALVTQLKVWSEAEGASFSNTCDVNHCVRLTSAGFSWKV